MILLTKNWDVQLDLLAALNLIKAGAAKSQFYPEVITIEHSNWSKKNQVTPVFSRIVLIKAIIRQLWTWNKYKNPSPSKLNVKVVVHRGRGCVIQSRGTSIPRRSFCLNEKQTGLINLTIDLSISSIFTSSLSSTNTLKLKQQITPRKR